jgi:REP element-mobilizing transposase RayT
MSRRPRFDAPGRLHHVMNRGIARRTVFETRADARYFLSLLAREVRKGNLRVYAFAILTTHFHLLVASPQGDISGAMRRVLNRYVRFFNRTRRRDGSLFRGRFRSRPVVSLFYRFTLIRYIDQNAVKARLAFNAAAYPYGSARLYAAARRPLWLNTTWVDTRMGALDSGLRAARYHEVFGPPLTAAEKALVTARIQGPAIVEDELDDLLALASPSVLRWMQRKAMLADQTKPGQVYVDARSVLARIECSQLENPDFECVPGKVRRRCAWPIVRVGLLRDLAGRTFQQIAQFLDMSQGSAQVRAHQHRRLVERDPAYAEVAANLAVECLDSLANP